MMDRRTFIGATGCSTFWPAHGLAQPTDRVRRIAVLSWWAPGGQDIAMDLEQRLAELGHVVGRNLGIEYRFADGDRQRVAALVKEILAHRPDIMICLATPAVEIAKATAGDLPIVFQMADALRTGMVESLARPGGNLTGISTTSTELSGKRLEMLREAVPNLQSVAFIGSALDPNGAVFAAETETAGAKLGLRVRVFLLRSPDEFPATFATIAEERIGAAVVQPLFVQYRQMLAELASQHRLPIIGDQRAMAASGLLMALGIERRAISRKLAEYADKILKGARPADLPVEQPTTFQLVVNLKAARALGLTIPPSILLRADEVIE
jgi:putative tryptophan/tyrosine transport system substrate-binding protein